MTRAKQLTNKLAVSALDVERVVALLLVGVPVLEQETVWAELGLRNAVDALVVLQSANKHSCCTTLRTLRGILEIMYK